MLDLILRTLQRTGFWIGLMFISAPLLIGGMKFYEHSTYLPTQATVLALATKCDMSYRTSKLNSIHRVIDCSDVADVKAHSPEINWSVSHVPYVEVAYATAAGHPVRAAAPLSKLERSAAIVGEQFTILQSRNNPGLITGPANAHFFRLWGLMLIGGIVMFAGSRGIKVLRTRGLLEEPDPLLARKSALFGQPLQTMPSTVESPRRQWRPSLPSHPPQFEQR